MRAFLSEWARSVAPGFLLTAALCLVIIAVMIDVQALR